MKLLMWWGSFVAVIQWAIGIVGFSVVMVIMELDLYDSVATGVAFAAFAPVIPQVLIGDRFNDNGRAMFFDICLSGSCFAVAAFFIFAFYMTDAQVMGPSGNFIPGMAFVTFFGLSFFFTVSAAKISRDEVSERLDPLWARIVCALPGGLGIIFGQIVQRFLPRIGKPA